MAKLPRAWLRGPSQWRLFHYVVAANLVVVAGVVGYAATKASRERAAVKHRVHTELKAVVAAYVELRSCLRGNAAKGSLLDVLHRRMFVDDTAAAAATRCDAAFHKAVDARLERRVWNQPRLEQLHVAAKKGGWSPVRSIMDLSFACPNARRLDVTLRAALVTFELNAKLPAPLQCELSTVPLESLRVPRLLWEGAPGSLVFLARADRDGVLITVVNPSEGVGYGNVVTGRALARTSDGARWEIVRMPSTQGTASLHEWRGDVSWFADISMAGKVRVRIHDHRCPGPHCVTTWQDKHGEKVRVHPLVGWKAAASFAADGTLDKLLARGAFVAVVTTKHRTQTLRVLRDHGAKVGEPVVLATGSLRYLMSDDGAVTGYDVRRDKAGVRLTSHHVAAGATEAVTSSLVVDSKSQTSGYVATLACSAGMSHWLLVEGHHLVSSGDRGRTWKFVATVEMDSFYDAVLQCDAKRLHFLSKQKDNVRRTSCTLDRCEKTQRLGHGHRAAFAGSDGDIVFVQGSFDLGYVVDVGHGAPKIRGLFRYRWQETPYLRAWAAGGHVFGKGSGQ